MIEFAGISKGFTGVPVLRDVSFAVAAGHTLGLVGENGAGKSTLMNILGGNLLPDAGQMRLNGQPYAPRNPQAATRHGIAFIHQELNLFANLSIAENIFLTAFPRSGGLPLINRGVMRRKAATLLDQVGLAHSPETPVEPLSAGERQLVEIAKALSLDARLLILDEPTTSLSARESETLFALMARLRARGLCDRILVMSHGEIRDELPRDEFDRERVLRAAVERGTLVSADEAVRAPKQ
ncbi:MAG: ATP-binding cassette domain-containing protein [Verrucomicrobiota bacterium]